MIMPAASYLPTWIRCPTDNIPDANCADFSAVSPIVGLTLTPCMVLLSVSSTVCGALR
jgi:hypothetical protein